MCTPRNWVTFNPCSALWNAVQFAPDNTVQIQADFISTGTIQLRMNLEVPSKLLQEDDGELITEQSTDDAIALEQA